MKFSEYVRRKDEASYNPLGNVSGLEGIGAAAGLPFAAGSGALAVAPQYRSMAYGNPYVSDNPKRTEHLARTAFEEGRDWILNNGKQYANWLLPQLNQVLKYVQSQKQQPYNVAGVTMGKQPSTLGRIFAVPGALIKGILTSAKNMIDTMNINYRQSKTEFMTQLQKVLLASDALPKEISERYLQEFISVLEGGGSSSHIDQDARYVKRNFD